MSGLILQEYSCAEHGRFESLEDRPGRDEVPCPICDVPSSWCISAPAVSIPTVSVSTGKWEPPPHAGFMSTRDVGTEYGMGEWRKRRAAYWEQRRKADTKDLLK